MTAITDDVPDAETTPETTPETVTERWAAYVHSVTADVPQTSIAARVGVSQTTISHWLTGRRKPTVYQARDLARAYGANPIEALIAGGFLTSDDIRVPSGDPRRIPTRVLLSEISRRMTGLSD